MGNGEETLTTALQRAVAADAVGLDGQLETLLDRLVDRGRSAWPELSLAPDRFVAFLARKVPAGGDVRDALSNLNIEDLYLACACATGDERAIATLEARLLPHVDQALVKLDCDEATYADAKQQLRMKLLLPRADGTRRIGQYSGRGKLKGWLQVSAVRCAIDLLRRRNKQAAERDDDLAVAWSMAPQDPELVHLKGRYREPFRHAFRGALRALSTRDRNVLRYYYVDGLSLERIAKIYGVHRATVGRWVSSAQRSALDATRKRLMEVLELDRGEYDSLMRAMASSIEITLQALMVGDEGVEGDPHDPGGD